MRACTVVVLLVSCVASPVAAQQVELFGYFESQLMGTKVKGSFVQMQSNKLRVDLKSNVSESVTFAANFDYITYHGKTKWNVLDYLPDEVTKVVPSPLREYYVLRFDNRMFLDNAYIRLAFKYVDVMVGKQQISLGTAYAWNPVDVFNTKDLLDPTYEQPGHNAVRLDVPLGGMYSATALYSVGDEWKNSTKMLSFKGRLSHFDYSILAIERAWTFHDYELFFLDTTERRRLLGLTTAGELLGLGVWAEYAFSDMQLSKDFHEFVIGADYTFDSQTYVMCEYYRNTLGKNNYKEYTLNDWMRLLASEQKAISRDQLYCFIQHPITDLITGGVSSVVSISDKSAAIIPTLNYNIFENVELLAYLNFYLGSEGKAFASNLGSGGLVRARVYF